MNIRKPTMTANQGSQLVAHSSKPIFSRQ